MSFCLICRNGTDLQINERLKKISLIYRNVDMQMEGFVYHLNASNCISIFTCQSRVRFHLYLARIQNLLIKGATALRKEIFVVNHCHAKKRLECLRKFLGKSYLRF